MATELNPIHDSGSQAGDGRSRVLALLEVGQSILSERNVSETLELIAQKALETSGAESAGVMLVDRSDGLVRYRAVAGRGDTAPLQSAAQYPVRVSRAERWLSARHAGAPTSRPMSD